MSASERPWCHPVDAVGHSLIVQEVEWEHKLYWGKTEAYNSEAFWCYSVFLYIFYIQLAISLLQYHYSLVCSCQRHFWILDVAGSFVTFDHSHFVDQVK